MWRAPWTGWEIAWCSTVRMGGWLPGWPAWRSGSTNYTCNWPVSTYLGREDRPDVKIHNFNTWAKHVVVPSKAWQMWRLDKAQKRQGRSLEDSDRASGDVHFSAQSSKKLCCNRCILKYDKMQAREGNLKNILSFFLQVNSGSGLAPEEGVFKAPKEGNYYFQFHGLVRKFSKTIRAGGITDGTD